MRTPRQTLPVLATALLVALLPPAVADASPPSQSTGDPEVLASGLKGGSGSAVGPDGALYVTEGVAGTLTRIEPSTGRKSIVATCLPKRVAPVGGAIDVAFVDGTAYVLVTLVSAEVGGKDVAGIYRIDGRNTCTVIADIGSWSAANQPDEGFEIFIAPGVQFALEPYEGGFVVTDGHHNRLLFVGHDGEVTELVQLPNVVPTGLDRKRSTIYLGLAGPVPHLPEDGRIVKLRELSPELREVASGAPLLVDVEFGCDHRLFGLGQGDFPEGQDEGAPALPNTGELRVADWDGSLHLVVGGLDQPTSLEIIGDAAYVVTLGGTVVVIPGVCSGGDHEHHD
jgi:hypothetical protein